MHNGCDKLLKKDKIIVEFHTLQLRDFFAAKNPYQFPSVLIS